MTHRNRVGGRGTFDAVSEEGVSEEEEPLRPRSRTGPSRQSGSTGEGPDRTVCPVRM